MDNRKFFIRSEGREAFDTAMKIAFNSKHTNEIASHYSEVNGALIFHWREEKTATKLPVELRWKEAADLAWNWLEKQPEDKYLDYLDHDGSDGHGFIVSNDEWNRVKDTSYGFVRIQPCWAWYGK